jgi:hypothetical protein
MRAGVSTNRVTSVCVVQTTGERFGFIMLIWADFEEVEKAGTPAAGELDPVLATVAA